MPNNVDQRLTIIGTKGDVEAFVVTARGAAPMSGDSDGCNARKKLSINPLCFHMFAPLDDDFSRKPYGDGDSYGRNAQADNWSVKWGAYDIEEAEISDDGTQATYAFQCSWSPPEKALQRASLRYRTLIFVLSYGGEGPCRGRRVFKGGEVTQSLTDSWETSMQAECAAATEAHGEDTDEEVDAHKEVEHKYIRTHVEFVALVLKEQA